MKRRRSSADYDEFWSPIEAGWKHIEDELSQYSYKAIAEFERIFPCENKQFTPGQEATLYGGYNYYSKNIIPKEGRERICNITLMCDNTFDHFWTRWNRFKKLVIFL